jgi:hypothetical protein
MRQNVSLILYIILLGLLVNPWKPVLKKKHVPKAPSLIVKEDTLYSIPWKPVKIIANNIVAIDPYKAPFLSPCIKA